MTVDELTQEQMQAYIHKAERVRKALEGAVEAMRVAKRDINNWFTSDEAKAAAMAPLEKAIAAGEEALK